MTSWERFKRMYEHKEADRVPIVDGPWSGTVRRWHREGMPAGADWRDYFDVTRWRESVLTLLPAIPRRCWRKQTGIRSLPLPGA